MAFQCGRVRAFLGLTRIKVRREAEEDCGAKRKARW